MGDGTSRSRVYIQITDPHLLSDESGRYNGAESLAGLRIVLEHVRAHFEVPAGFLVTGDLVHDGSRSGYRHFVDAFAGWDCPVHVISRQSRRARDPERAAAVRQHHAERLSCGRQLGDLLSRFPRRGA